MVGQQFEPRTIEAPPRRAKILVLGLGNPLLGDDSVGLRVAQQVQAQLADRPEVEVAEDYWGGLRLMERLAGFERVIIVDAICSGGHGDPARGSVRGDAGGRDRPGAAERRGAPARDEPAGSGPQESRLRASGGERGPRQARRRGAKRKPREAKQRSSSSGAPRCFAHAQHDSRKKPQARGAKTKARRPWSRSARGSC